MASKRKRRSRRGWDQPGDEMVPIRGDRVKAALDAYGASVSGVAAEVGDSQQTLSLICRGVSKRTRRSRVVRLAQVLDVPEEWLTGRQADLPGGVIMPGVLGGAAPAAWQLAISRWVAHTGKAHSRDARRPGRKKRLIPFDAFLRQGFALTLFINPGVWREVLLEGYSAAHDAFEDPNDPLSEDTTVQLVDAMLAILHPWTKGTHRLNYRNLMALLGRHAESAVKTLEAESPNWRAELAAGKEIGSRAGPRDDGTTIG